MEVAVVAADGKKGWACAPRGGATGLRVGGCPGAAAYARASSTSHLAASTRPYEAAHINADEPNLSTACAAGQACS